MAALLALLLCGSQRLQHDLPHTTMAELVFDNTVAERRAETAAFIVSVYKVYMQEIAAGHSTAGTTTPELPSPPAHVSDLLRDECYDVAKVLAQAASNIREYIPSRHSSSPVDRSCATDTLPWDAAHYAASLQRSTVPTVEYENALLSQFAPLGPIDRVMDDTKPLPVISDPCVFCDRVGRQISWSLPSVMSERHQVYCYVAQPNLGLTLFLGYRSRRSPCASSSSHLRPRRARLGGANQPQMAHRGLLLQLKRVAQARSSVPWTGVV